MSEICTNQCRWIAPLSVVSLMFAVLVPYAASGLVVYTVSSESVARGSSDGFGSEASDDGAVNVKTEGAATARVDVTLLPNGDVLNEWAGFGGCQTDGIAFDELDEDPADDDATCRGETLTSPPFVTTLSTAMQDILP